MKARCVLPIVCMLLLLSACDKRPQAIQKSEGELTARVKWTRQSLTITNRDSFDWNYVLFGLNLDGRVRNAYVYVTRTVRQGETIEIKTRDFFLVYSNKRFDVNNTMLRSFSICEGDPDDDNMKRVWRGLIYDYK